MSALFNGRMREKLVFCDKKAENEQYSFEGINVISPSLLLKEYEKGRIQKIIIASIDYAEQIYSFLTESGVKRGHILVADNI